MTVFQVRDVSSYYIHEHYGQRVDENGTVVEASEESKFHNDLCMVYLDDDFIFTESVSAVAGATNYTVLAGTQCVVAGWGVTRVSEVMSNGGCV